MSARPTVLVLDDGVELRILQEACSRREPGPWLSEFLAPESITTRDFGGRMSEFGRDWNVVIDDQVPEHADPDVLVVERNHPSAHTLDTWADLRGVVVYARSLHPEIEARYRARGLPVTFVRRTTTDSVADHTMLLVLALVRRFSAAVLTPSGSAAGPAPSVLSGATPAEVGAHPPTVFNWSGVQGIRPLAGLRLVVYGAGEIGAEVLRRAAAFGMQLGYCDRTARPHLEQDHGATRLSADEVATWSDVVSLHLPYSPQVHHLVDRDFLSALGPQGYLVNTARGLLVDGEALRAALDADQLGGAGLDVHTREPLPDGDPLLHDPRVILTPHVGAGSRWLVLEDARRTAAAVETFLDATSPPASPD